jgi:uncharacterized protein (DUF58 family)
VKFRPTPLAHALAVTLAWAVLLAVALDRPEFLCLALPLVVPLLRGAAPPRTEIIEAALAVDTSARSEGDELVVTVTAVAAGDPTGPLQFLLVRPPLARLLDERGAPVFGPGPRERMLWRYRLRCEATGVLEFGEVFFRAWDRSGLWVGEWRHEQRAWVPVHPRAEAVRRVPVPRHTGAPFGPHTSAAAGEGIEFAGIRPFVPGDRVRQINWPVSLRRGALHANRFHTDRQADVILLIDTCTDIGRRPGSALDHILRAAAGLAAAYLRRHDRVGVLEYGGVARSTRLAAGQGQYRRILDALSRSAVITTDLGQDLTTLPGRILPRHALVIALTPLIDGRFVRAVCQLADRGQDVVLLALGTDELSDGLLRRRDAGRLARRLWRLEREDRLRELRGHGIRAVHWPPDRLLEAVLGTVPRPATGRSAPWYA